MCDYSLHSVKSRPAKVGDKLITRNFGTGTRGFAAAENPNVAVCVLPGTELSFVDDVRCQSTGLLVWRDRVINHKTAIFRQLNKERAATHHDALEFPDGQIVLLTSLSEGSASHSSSVAGRIKERRGIRGSAARSLRGLKFSMRWPLLCGRPIVHQFGRSKYIRRGQAQYRRRITRLESFTAAKQTHTMMTIMTKMKRMTTTTRKTKSSRLSENPTNVDFEDGITDVKRTPSDVRPGCSRASGAVKRRDQFLPALELQDTLGDLTTSPCTKNASQQ